MRHVTISNFGQSVGVTGSRLVVTERDGKRWETALSRLRSIRIEKKGVSISSDLILACAARGIRIFILDWRNIASATLSGNHQHAVVALRDAQFEAIRQEKTSSIAREFIFTKVRNQRAVLLYFSKYLTKVDPQSADILRTAAQHINDIALTLKGTVSENWREDLLGREGKAANYYWNALIGAHLVPLSFVSREGRGSTEITNAALNYGYSILQSYVWGALDNAGFELYAGFLHKPRPGRASLVMDVMEEYRAWVVDRNIVKLRSVLSKTPTLDKKQKAMIVEAIDNTMTSTINWNGKNIRLENVLQRQVYRLGGSIVDGNSYKGIRFKW